MLVQQLFNTGKTSDTQEFVIYDVLWRDLKWTLCLREILDADLMFHD